MSKTKKMKNKFYMKNTLLIVFFSTIFSVIHAQVTFNAVYSSDETSCDGSITSEIEGIGDYFFKWNTGEATNSIEDLCPTSYSLTITDTYGCSTEYSFNIGVCEAIEYASTEIVPTCDASGYIGIKLDNINPPYTFYWENQDEPGVEVMSQDDPGGKTQLVNLNPGVYCVTITDAYGCTREECFSTFLYGAEQPYVERVDIFTEMNPDELLYSGTWQLTPDDCVDYTGGMWEGETLATLEDAGIGIVIIKAYSNEPLDLLKLDAFGQSGLGSDNEDKTEFEFAYSASEIVDYMEGNGSSHTLVFDGKNQFNNIIPMHSVSGNLTECVLIPTLQDDCTYTPDIFPGAADKTHVFSINCLAALPVFLTDTDEGEIEIENYTDDALYAFNWSGPSINEQNIDDTRVSGDPGLYCVTITDIADKLARGCTSCLKQPRLRRKQKT